MEALPPRQLRVLLADERQENLEHVAAIVARLGHLVVGRETNIPAAAKLADREVPDVAIIVVGADNDRALHLIDVIVREAVCPAIAVLDAQDPAFINEAAKRGVFAYLANGDLGDDELASALTVVLHRFAEYHDLEGAFGRRALIERAKGVLMERHGIDEEAAFRMIREHSRSTSRKLMDVVEALLASHAILRVPPDGERD